MPAGRNGRKMMRKTLLSLALPALLAACGYVDRYEAGVYDFEPVYCYRTIGAVRCFKTPDHRDERRLVNYYGPHPSRYERPAPAARPAFKAPPPVAFYVRDPEPVPEPVRPRRRPAADEAGAAADIRLDVLTETFSEVRRGAGDASEAPAPEAAPLTPVLRVEDGADVPVL